MPHVRAARTVAALSAGFWAVLFFGLIDLSVVFDGTPTFYDSYLLETGWGLLYTVMVAAPLMALAIRPGSTSLVAHIVVVSLCVGLTGVAAFSWLQLLPAAGLLLNAAILHKLLGAGLRPRGGGWAVWSYRSPQRPTLIVGCLAILPSVVVAADLVRGFWELRPPTDDDTWSIDHWPTQAALALAVPAVTILASVRAPGWLVSLWTAALAAAWWGAVSIAYPQHAGSLGTVGGWVAIGWAIVAMLTTARPSPPRPPDARGPSLSQPAPPSSER